ncbi:hypothetical protein SARC_02388 [Sphaeroforma arctica JP610]|uniref:MSP domain-containing protein n=1 Tax=Sphaeroforma arctica JP610 TaxID=667725 RepID=A0A0L0GAY9_9EUKA|nr:hypothetical protein SARC_02388 [Sphaeroforma arctica JP610]KNC85438.1 hypothetical protein SARC_02388 [Sphaeroforma arctica JP610]|eukprot:XP_014159340.1 hypothetical protein SARC_02388 [Sphaeroforma arctica JP610]
MSHSYLEVEPRELEFINPGTQPVNIRLVLKNPNSTAIAYKIKTTAPRRYCVRPNHGKVLAGKSESVEIILNSLKPEELNAPCKDKFLILTTLDKESGLSCDDLFKSVAKSEIGEAKLKCKYCIDSSLSSAKRGSEAGRTLSAVLESPTSANHESELAKLKKVNGSLKESNREIQADIDELKSSGLRQRKDAGGPKEYEPDLATKMIVAEKGAQNQLVLILTLLLMGWFVGHFII